MRHFGHVGSPTEGDDPTAWTEPPLLRFGTGRDVASAVVFLLSEESSFITGTELLIDGGLQAGVAG
jgi:3alpha(or 20beta)-hydroxysteroid dehydrogenase